MTALAIQDLHVRFGAFRAVEHLSLEVEEGQFLGLLGPNGAGKTTTIQCIAGLHPPTSGQIRVAGYDPIDDVLDVRRVLGVVPQSIALYPSLSVLRNLQIFAGLHGLSGRALKQRVRWAIEVADLAGREKTRVETLSGGMQRRLNLVASLLHDPEIIICDEPTANVDPSSRKLIFNILRELHAQGRTIIYTSHYMEEVESLCSHVAIMAWGELVAHDLLEDLLGDGHTEFRLVTAHPARLEEVRDGLRKGEIDIQSVRVSQRSLEDVFFELTGRTLRG